MINEDKDTVKRVSNPLGAYLNAKYRSDLAEEIHKSFFDTDEHVERVCAVSDIIKSFFGSRPSYYTKRGLGSRKPFESVKYSDAVLTLRRRSAEEKEQYLYKPLRDLGRVDVKVDNGHLIVRIY